MKYFVMGGGGQLTSLRVTMASVIMSTITRQKMHLFPIRKHE